MKTINVNKLKHYKEDLAYKMPREELLYSIFIIGTLITVGSIFLGSIGLLVYWVVK